MYLTNVAVVSANPTLLRFFELECQLWGCSVRTFSRMPSNTEPYSHIFVDIDTVRHHSSERAHLITVSARNISVAAARHLMWPVTVNELRRLLCDSEGRAQGGSSEHAGQEEPILWLQSRERREIRYDSQTAVLSVKELLLLDALSNAEKKPVRRETLMRLFGAEAGNIADVYVCHLRKKLEQLCERRAIETVRGVGYRLLLSVREAETE